jgi:hypothetical protein
MFWIGIIVLLFLVFTVLGLIENIVWVAAIAGIAWGMHTGGVVGYGFAAVALFLIAVYETNRG